ncbi:AMP-binding protein [Streptomyces gamaensis]|uniref:AMP-binding protein n=1 Tax=Streptomyces gamaensis TaxID=1763542 RepID=A0ABW0Z265_9ACTN
MRKSDAGARLREIVAFVLEIDVEDVRSDASFHQELKVDSLEKVEIAARMEQTFKVAFSDDETAAVDSVDEALALLLAKTAGAAGAPHLPPEPSGTPAAGPSSPAGTDSSAAPRPSSPAAAAPGPDLLRRLLGAHLAAGRGGRTAYVDPDAGEISYGQLQEAARGYAQALTELGIEPGARGLIVAEDSVATAVAVLGLWWHGSVPVPVTPMLGEADLRYVAEDCEAALVHLDLAPAGQRALEEAFADLPQLTGDQVREALATGAATPAYRADGPPPAPAPPAGRETLIQYTSGSTGRPKGVRHAADGIAAMLDGFGRVMGLRPEDRVLSTARMSFGYGFGSSVLCTLDAGASAVLVRGAVEPHAISAALRRHRPTVLCSVPRLYVGLLEAFARHDGEAGERPFPSLRLCLTAGENCPAALSRRIEEGFGVTVMNCLGATEVMHVAIATPPARSMHGRSGVAVPGVTVTVRDDEGVPVPDGADGRLHISGPQVSLGYLNRADADRATFGAGGAYTGDVVRKHPDGSVEYLCRADDILNLGGYKVVPSEIEDVVRSTEGVRDCVVLGSADANGLERSVAFTVIEEGFEADAVRRAIRGSVRARLAPYKRPSRFEFVDVLPATATGKLAAYKLRERMGQS